MQTTLLHKTMEQNHKHHRRRRRRLVSSNGNWPPATTAINISTTTNHHLQSVAAAAKPATTPFRRLLPLFTSSTVVVVVLFSLLFALSAPKLSVVAQQQQNFLLPSHNMENLRIHEIQPVDSIVYLLKAADRFNETRKFSYHMTGDVFSVDEQTGEVRLRKPLDRERQPFITVVVSIFDSSSESNVPVESKRRTIVVEDVDDSWPIFAPHRNSVTMNPAQSHYVYQVNISEQAPINSIVLAEIQVTDADEGPNAELVFECRARQSTIGTCEAFALEPRRTGPGKYSVTIRTRAQLDYERVPAYKMSLVARGKRASPIKPVAQPLEAEATININLINVQDEGPVFVNAPYSLSMKEGLKNGTRLLSLIVQDGDAAPQRDLTMIVVSGLYSEYFQVSRDPDSSKIFYLETNATIDRENPLIADVGNMFNISLLAAELDEETGMPVASEAELLTALSETTTTSYFKTTTLKRETVTIVVLDLPDSQPVFVQASTGQPVRDNSLVFNISESIVTGASVPNLDLAVHDLDQGINSRFKLSLVDSDDTGPQASKTFALESEIIYGKAEVVLNILNSSLLDYEQPGLRTYRFNLVASKNVDPPLVQILEMQINIVDANDNSPEFDRDQYIVDVPEGALPGTVVATIKAHDKDSGPFGKVDYMLRGTGASKFKLISGEGGKIVVDDCGIAQCLDYEIQPSFSLTCEARDGGGRTKNVSVIINVLDVNDHGPRFTEQVYKRELISDNLSSKHNYISPQLIVRAKDGDGPSQGRDNVTYRITSTNLTGLEVDPVTGLVYLSQPIDLDNMISSAFESNAANNGNGGGRGGSNDKKIIFSAEILAEDNGSPMLNSSARILLVVKGNRDGAPQFKQDLYQAFVRENQPINKPFFQVQAIDPDDKDSQLRYSLGYDLNDLVSINAVSGELSFKNKVDFDDFKGLPYNVTVYSTDNSRPYPLSASAIVSILIQDVNDKPPKFDELEYKATLAQGETKQGDVVLRVNAVDSDRNAQLNYSIVADQLSVRDRNGQLFGLEELVNSTTGYLSQMTKSDRVKLATSLKRLFQIDRKTGAIEMKSEPDYSFAASISIPVRVLDLNQEVFTPTGELQQDFATCTFFLKTPVGRNPIFAPPWSIDKRDYNISMLEELSIGTQIYSLLAKDPATNERIDTFEKVFESDPKDYFRVDRSGIVSVNRRIDFEDLPAPKRLSVSVKALTNDVFYSVARLNIQVIDLNDNAPQFKSQNYSTSVSEAVKYPQEILTVAAEDKDSNEFGQVYYSLSGYSSELFAIEPRRGIVTLKKGARLDRDSEPVHSLIVTASDCNDTRGAQDSATTQLLQHDVSGGVKPEQNSGCKKSSVFVSVMLIDENDNDPVFINANKRGEFEALASETVSNGSVIGQIQAVDIDEGLNGQVGYEIVRGDDAISKLIKIDRDGCITVTDSLSGMGRASPYWVTIRAFDHGTPASRQTQANLLLTISDVVANDGIPKFVRPKADEVISLSENAGAGTFVYQVQALDPDEESNGKLMYKFIQPSDVFEIDPFTGVIKTQARSNFFLDRELVANYTLIIVAQDLGTPPKQAHQVLSIKITDINDNEPYFERGLDDPPVVIYVEEEVPKDFLVGTIQAIDKDVEQNALIGYEILEGNHNNMFRLSYEFDHNHNDATSNGSSSSNQLSGNNPCRIYSTGRLDRETRESYTLTIKASSMSKLRNPFIHQFRDPLGGRNPFNQYNATDLSKIKVTIKLVDINDNRPVFVEQNAKSVVDSSAEIYSQLMVFKATDADSSSQEIQYSIMDALYYSDSKLRPSSSDDLKYTGKGGQYQYNSGAGLAHQPVSMRHVFDIDSRTGILRNSVSLRPYIDGYFEVLVKADSGLFSQQPSREPNDSESSYTQLLLLNGNKGSQASDTSSNKCSPQQEIGGGNTSMPANGDNVENCFVAITKAVVFVTHQRETFRFVFNKTKLNDRLEEFKSKIQSALEELMFEPQPLTDGSKVGSGRPESSLAPVPRAERVYLNTFNTDFYEREDGSLDFSTLTSCSQLVKFDDKSSALDGGDPLRSTATNNFGGGGVSVVPNQVINYDEVLNLLKTLNATQTRQLKSSLFSQYGLVNIERCLPDKTMYKMTLSERVAIYFAIAMAAISVLLAVIVSKMRKSYEKNLKLLQRSKYQYMSQYATLPPGVHLARPAHHMSLGALQAASANNFIAPPYGSQVEFEGPSYDTWQL